MSIQEYWNKEGAKPAWLHADSATSHSGKVQLFQEQSQWRLEKDDPQPKCTKLGRKLADDDSVIYQASHSRN